jgi:Dolichyl-phosphate-mannose-protein mannosyltransferase
MSPSADDPEATGVSRAGTTRIHAPAGFAEWLDAHSTLAALALVLAGFLLRLWRASGTFLNPDEAMHVVDASWPTLGGAYTASLRLAHPPLLILLLHVWRGLGTSELMLRLPSVIAGTVFCWVFYRWLMIALGRGAAWVGMILACFLPPMIELSAEVRQYALLLCFLMLALYWLERAFEQGSARKLFLSAISLYLAVLTHFSGILFAGALGVYGLLRLVSGRRSKRLAAVWAGSQAGALALLAFLYRTQISHLRGSEVERETMHGMLAASYFHWGAQPWPVFALARSFGVFQFTFGQLAVGDLAGLLFLAGVILLLKGRTAEGGRANPRLLGVFLLLPFVITCGAALADLYPYGGTRHSAFLAPFALAGVSYGLVKLASNRIPVAMGAAIAIVAACTGFGHPHRPYMRRRDQRRANMTEAVDFLRQNVRPDEPILIDFQTYFPIHVYLCRDVPPLLSQPVPEFITFPCAGRRVIAAGPRTNNWDRATFLGQWPELAQNYGLTPGETVWVAQMGWEIGLGQQLQAMPEFDRLRVKSSGRDIQLFKLKVARPVPLMAGPP